MFLATKHKIGSNFEVSARAAVINNYEQLLARGFGSPPTCIYISSKGVTTLTEILVGLGAPVNTHHIPVRVNDDVFVTLAVSRDDFIIDYSR